MYTSTKQYKAPSHCEKEILVVLLKDAPVSQNQVSNEDHLHQYNHIRKEELQSKLEDEGDFASKNVLIFLFDIGKKTEYDIDVISFLSKKYERFRVLRLSTRDLQFIQTEIMPLGAISFIERYASFSKITNCVRNINKNAYYMAPSLFGLLFEYVAGAKPVRNTTILTPRQDQILSLLSQGKTYKQIGDQLFISHNTVGFHIKQAYKKLGVTNGSQAISRYVQVSNPS